MTQQTTRQPLRTDEQRLLQTLETLRDTCAVLATGGPRVRRMAQDIFVRTSATPGGRWTDDAVVFDLVMTARQHPELQGANRDFNVVAAAFAAADALGTLLGSITDNERRMNVADIVARMLLERMEDDTKQRSELLDDKRVRDAGMSPDHSRA